MAIFCIVLYLSSVYCTNALSTSKSPEAAKEPLLLTPHIKAGELQKARTLSRVEPLLDKVESYAGYFTVDESKGSNLFFWHFPRSGVEPRNATTPVILWLGGGPGMSSLVSLFRGTGPFRVAVEKNNSISLKKEEFTWTKNYHVLYIDQPIGTGFSFTVTGNGSVTTTAQAVDQVYEALQQFYKVFAELRRHDLYLAGESYAGKYIPALGYKIHQANLRRDCAGRTRLKGMIIGNGFIDPENMMDFDQLLHAAGLIDENERKIFKQLQTEVGHLMQSGSWTEAYDVYYRKFLQETIGYAIGTFNYYDYRSDDTDGDYFDTVPYTSYVTQDRIRERIHVHRVPYFPFSEEVGALFVPDSLRTVRPLIEKLLDNKYPMLFYGGQFDIACAPVFTEKSLDKLQWRGAKNFSLAKKHFWRANNELLGHYKSVGNLVFLTVHGAGHSVTMEQPKTARNMIDAFIKKKFGHCRT